MSTRLHRSAVLQALFVVLLWSTSWVLIKFGLQDIAPLTFAGLRYTLAFLCLLVLLRFRPGKTDLKLIPRRTWALLIILGLCYYTLTQGACFIALDLLPAVTVNLLLSFNTIAVAALGIIWLRESPAVVQWLGIFLALGGAVLYFFPASFPENFLPGLAAAVVGVLANSFSSILGRDINRTGEISPLLVTGISMGIGSVLLLGTGLLVEGMPQIDLKSWGIILWLAVVNTAFAFTLWNNTLRTLTAVESSIINGTMMIWIPVLAVVFLDEHISLKEGIALVVVGVGTLIVQLRQKPGEK